MTTNREWEHVKSLMNSTAVRVGAVIFFRGRNPSSKERGFAETLVRTKNQKLNLNFAGWCSQV